MSDRLDDLERRIDVLRAGVRGAMRAKDTATARSLRADLRRAERAWDALVSSGPADDPANGPETGNGPESGTRSGPESSPDGEPTNGPANGRAGGRGDGTGLGGGPVGGLVTVREQVHQALSLLGAPAQPRLIVAVAGAFFGGTLRSNQLTSLRRDEERSFRASPYGRPYYLCAALTDRLSPARALLTVSTWPQERRMVGPLSPRVDFLTCAIAVAEHPAQRHGRERAAARLLARMARNIPGGSQGGQDLGPPDPARVADAARAELAVHAGRDGRDRAGLAGRATSQLGDVARLFGAATLSSVAKEGATA